MGLVSGKIIEAVAFLVWFLLWAVGGIWIARSAFNLRKNEQVIAGVGLGLVRKTGWQTWFHN